MFNKNSSNKVKFIHVLVEILYRQMFSLYGFVIITEQF